MWCLRFNFALCPTNYTADPECKDGNLALESGGDGGDLGIRESKGFGQNGCWFAGKACTQGPSSAILSYLG